ncbi:hypothetical protein INT45_011480 [Circinella minor]|uniref:Uncharacterized protein n=1 Tax=Circinella minor TaxID=1195481 RepID=A0A8H7VEW1_9FUNG|nr:hypothetical protein INT45_011480 [Circinella minor]
MNLTLFQYLITSIQHIPTYFIYLKWRYWIIGSRFHRIIRRNIIYSKTESNTCQLDIYYPDTSLSSQTPIIIFLYGSILPPHSTYYILFANTLRELGYIVIIPNFQHERHIQLAIKWAYRHACEKHLDPEMIYLMGHGTGAQKAIHLVLNDVLKKAKCYINALPSNSSTDSDNSGKHDPSSSIVNNNNNSIISNTNEDHLYDFLPPIEGLLLFAGIYDRKEQSDNPLQLIKENRYLFETSRDLIDFFPRILFVHGEKDTIISVEESMTMYSILGDVLPPDQRDEVDVRMRLYKKLNHNQCITSLMSTSSYDRMNKLLSQDIKEFIDLPTPHHEDN